MDSCNGSDCDEGLEHNDRRTQTGIDEAQDGDGERWTDRIDGCNHEGTSLPDTEKAGQICWPRALRQVGWAAQACKGYKFTCAAFTLLRLFQSALSFLHWRIVGTIVCLKTFGIWTITIMHGEKCA